MVARKTSTGRARKDCFLVGLIINEVVKSSRDIQLGIALQTLDEKLFRFRFFHGSPATKTENIIAFASSGLDGLIICGFSREVVLGYLRAMPNHPPTIIGLYSPLLKSESRGIGRYETVVLDNALIGRMAADFFLRHGLRNFYFVGGCFYSEKESGEIRSKAFWDRLGELGNKPESLGTVVFGSVDAQGNFWAPDLEEIREWLAKIQFPCGVFVNDELEALALLKVCRDVGVDVPGQLEVLCVNNSYGFCERANPTISNIQIDFDRIFVSAIEKLRLMLLGGAMSRQKTDELSQSGVIELVERGSTASGRGYGRVAERAREFIRVHACEKIGIEALVKCLGVSRRSMERHVREATGKSALQLIRSARLDETCRLLRTTDIPITEITERVGYNMTTNLCVLFKREFGMSMRQYRAQHRKS